MARIPPTARKALLTLHLVTSLGWLGTDLVLLTLGVAVQRGADPAVVYPVTALLGTVLFAPLSVLVWLVGVVSALLTPWGLLRYRWVLAKLALTTVMVGLVLFLLTPNLRHAGELGAALPTRDRADLVIAPAVSTSLMIIATVLSTYKPWGRRPTRPGRATDAARPARATRATRAGHDRATTRT
ncbi:hypothetical protein JNW91_13170 [Micromonospora sp. STR1_7]|uniref:DUF2269 domain-containing protein n=1 Tax=Micromonospora parastrephiae TaxID=2806101 RepID=A0ABS1XTY1_9ACTN|nr:hypothetical protein [Micromonospora parastrephiae]MBM0232727.1 hypothetical protein [Micromonospora parastrephiae]